MAVAVATTAVRAENVRQFNLAEFLVLRGMGKESGTLVLLAVAPRILPRSAITKRVLHDGPRYSAVRHPFIPHPTPSPTQTIHDGTTGDGDRGRANLVGFARRFFLPSRNRKMYLVDFGSLLPLLYCCTGRKAVFDVRDAFLAAVFIIYIDLFGGSTTVLSHFPGGVCWKIDRHLADVVFKVELSMVECSLFVLRCWAIDKRKTRHFLRVSTRHLFDTSPTTAAG